MKTAREQMRDALTEAEFQDAVISAAKIHGWRLVHFETIKDQRDRWRTPFQGDAGFVDLVLVHGKRGIVIFAELKAENGRMGPGQADWHNALKQVEFGSPGTVFARIWRPSDWDYIVALLAGRKTHG